MDFSKYHLLLIISLVVTSVFTTQAENTSLFSHDIELYLKNKTDQLGILENEYISVFDQFGTTALFDGDSTITTLDALIEQDILAKVEKELEYDKQEAKYLEDEKTTPAEVLLIEGEDGSDVPLDAKFNPHPSLILNPDINFSSTEDITTKNIEEIILASSTEKFDESTTSTKLDDKVIDGIIYNDSEIYKAILNGEDIVPLPDIKKNNQEEVPNVFQEALTNPLP